jgi:hypothetical protein
MKYGQTFAEAYRQVRLGQETKEVKEDYEVSMAIGQLKTIIEYATKLIPLLESKGADYNIEAWVQSKITTAEDYMNSVGHYMENNPSVSEAVDEKEGDDANKVADLKTKLSKEKDSDRLERQIVVLTNQIGMLKQQLDNEKNKVVKPEPNPDTGEVPLRTGVAAALLDKKGPKPDVDKQSKTKVELSKKKSKIEINPDVDMGVFSGGNKMNQGNLY